MATETGHTRPRLRPGLALRRTDLAGAPIVYDDPPRRRQPQLQARDMEIMRALWRYTFLTTAQIGETWWPERHPSRPQIRLAELAGSGLLARFRPLVRRGTHQWIYQLAREGFRAAQKAVGPDGTYVDEHARWSERRAADISSVEQILRVNGWMLAYSLILEDRMLDWRGARDARIAQPQAPRGTGDGPGVSPDAAVLIDLEAGSAPLELLVELGRDERPVRVAERLGRYDDLLGRSWRLVARFQAAGSPPAAAFIARSYREVDRLLRAADATVGTPARSRLIVCAEPDLHRGDPRAWMLPPQPPDQRGSTDFTATAIALPV